jgi:NADH pyrophosphatase NudC (nudix superfamily)
VDFGESVAQAVVRETLEESQIEGAVTRIAAPATARYVRSSPSS